MRTTTVLALTASFLLSLADALALEKQAPAPPSSPKVVRMDTQRIPVANPATRDRLRRRGAVGANLDNEETLYFVNGSLGTPAQNLRLHLDTGSSDLWVNTPSSQLCMSSDKPCALAGTYGANASSTYAYVGSWFNISYVDGSGASGDYATDVFSLGGGSGATTLPSLQFGIGYASSVAQGILGIGYPLNEVQVGRAGRQAYDNLPAQMVADGLISASAYSLWLNDLDASMGSILFGGVDAAQFTGPLSTLPIEPEGGQFSQFLVTLTGVSLGGTTVASDMGLAVLLDSGSSLTYLPDDVVETIYDQVGAQYNAQQGVAYVPCSLAADDDSSAAGATTLDFEFTSPTISVAMRELVLDMTTAGSQEVTYQDGQSACLFGVAPAGTGTNVLGDTFLRSAYVVFDLGNNQVSLAQTLFNASSSSDTDTGTGTGTSSNVREIASGTAGVPGATVVPSPARATTGGGQDSDLGLASGASPALGGSSSLAGMLAVVCASLVAGFVLVVV